MVNKTEQNGALFELARLMINLNVRACVIAQTLGISETEARSWYRQIRGEKSPSGQQPSDMTWFLKTPERRYQSALLLSFYQLARPRMPARWAAVHAYKTFAEMVYGSSTLGAEQDYVLPFSRAHHLIQMWSDMRLVQATTARHKIAAPFTVGNCRTCNTMYLTDVNDANRQCPHCASAKVPSKAANLANMRVPLAA
jgi:hypothetical protein